MIKNPFFDIGNKKAVVVYKHSRYTYAMERGSNLSNIEGQMTKDLIDAHEKNLKCIETVMSTLNELGIDYRMLCRSDMQVSDLKDRLVISVGGDGTLLDASHFCEYSPILGVNSDPDSSIGALCIATSITLRDILLEIYQGTLTPSRLARLSIEIGGKKVRPLALNDVLFCNKNPAAMSRFVLSKKNRSESHRSSGIWIATAAGSTGGIYSSGAKALPLDKDLAIFRLREPYWANTITPKLLQGTIKRAESLIIQSHMTDGEIFIDGPHIIFDIALGETLQISLADQPLWLFDGPRLNKNRRRHINLRKLIRFC